MIIIFKKKTIEEQIKKDIENNPVLRNLIDRKVALDNLAIKKEEALLEKHLSKDFDEIYENFRKNPNDETYQKFEAKWLEIWNKMQEEDPDLYQLQNNINDLNPKISDLTQTQEKLKNYVNNPNSMTPKEAQKEWDYLWEQMLKKDPELLLLQNHFETFHKDNARFAKTKKEAKKQLEKIKNSKDIEPLEEHPDLRMTSKEIEELINTGSREYTEKENYHTFSKDFDDKIQQMLEEVNHTPLHPNVACYKKKQRIRQISLYLASCILLFIVATAIFHFTNATAVSKFFIRFVQQLGSEQVQVVLDIDESIPLHTNLYEPDWIPRGYKKVDEELNDTSYHINYKSDTGNYITYKQFDIKNYQINENYSKSTTIDKITYYYKLEDRQTLIKWSNHDTLYSLIGSTDLQTLLKVAQTLQRKDINFD